MYYTLQQCRQPSHYQVMEVNELLNVIFLCQVMTFSMTPSICFNVTVACWFQILWRKESEHAVQLNLRHWQQQIKRQKWATARDIARTLHNFIHRRKEERERINKKTVWGKVKDLLSKTYTVLYCFCFWVYIYVQLETCCRYMYVIYFYFVFIFMLHYVFTLISKNCVL
jgi:hypothetical protein